MKVYLINVTFNDPFPKTREYRESGGKIEVAIGKSLRKFRKEPDVKGRPIKQISVKATQL